MAYITIKYTGKNDTLQYNGVEMVTRNDHKYEYNSGNFVKDWYDAKKKFLDFASDELFLNHSSSVDHFIMDGANFDSAWFVWDKDDPRLVYEFDEKGWEMFVPKGTKPTWEELKHSIGYGKQKQLT